jgi:hypothetical protein
VCLKNFTSFLDAIFSNRDYLRVEIAGLIVSTEEGLFEGMLGVWSLNSRLVPPALSYKYYALIDCTTGAPELKALHLQSRQSVA